eukprot:SAG22_NODE_2801_length_2199_cov_2.029524_2_plen_391_part_00
MVEVSDEPGCVDSKPNCACFPYWCWRRNQSACLADPVCHNSTKGGPSQGGPLLQNVTRYPATEWFHSAMPRDPKTGVPLCETAADSQTACLEADGKFMDTATNAAALNYSLHQALVTGLTPGKTYYYRVGSTDGLPHDYIYSDISGGTSQGWSDIVAFTAFPPAHREPIWAIYGDMGATTDQWRNIAPSIPVLAKDQEEGLFDGVLHAGDYAYDLAPYGGRVGDRFMNLIQPFASRVPYMAGIGNHESGGTNRKHFSMRFAGMQYTGENSGASNAGNSDNGDQLWWSFDAGLIHFIAVDSELWNSKGMKPHGTNESRWSSVWNPKTDSALVDEFMGWLKKDVEKANNNRQEVPWVVGFAHKGERAAHALMLPLSGARARTCLLMPLLSLL